AVALGHDAELAPAGERPATHARIGQVLLSRVGDTKGALDAFARALGGDPTEKTSRTALEKLLGATDAEVRLAAARVLEPLYRRDGQNAGLLRVLELYGELHESPKNRLAALEEAMGVSDAAKDVARALELAARALGVAVAIAEPTGPWLFRFERY